jgi:CheY-like chemotaxis protein
LKYPVSRILVVDDEKGIIRFFKAAFQQTGAVLYVSDSVENAICILQSKPVDIIAGESGL